MYETEVEICRIDMSVGEIEVLGFFFFKQKTAYEIGTGDWSSDVCSSDLSSSCSKIQSNRKWSQKRQRQCWYSHRQQQWKW